MLKKINSLFLNREMILYILFGVLTTLIDWIVYVGLGNRGLDYKVCTAASWTAAVLFAFITNKVIVFRSYNYKLKELAKEFISFVSCRIATGLMTLFGMMFFVDCIGINDIISKLILSVLVIILNYVFSKIFIFRKNN